MDANHKKALSYALLLGLVCLLLLGGTLDLASGGKEWSDAPIEARASGYDFWQGFVDGDAVVEGCVPDVVGRLRCSDAAGDFVGPHIALFDGKPRRCIWTRSKEANERRIVFSDIPVGSEIRGGWGAPAGVAGNGDASLRVLVGGREALHERFEEKPGSWMDWKARLRKSDGARADVTFLIEGEDGRLPPVCFDAIVLDRRQGERP